MALRKMFGTGPALDQALTRCRVVQRYETFAIVEVDEGHGVELPSEDVSGRYDIIGRSGLPISEPAAAAEFTVAAAEPVEVMTAGPHHYILQLIGPTLERWRRAVTRAGAETRATLGPHTSIIRAGDAAITRLRRKSFVRRIMRLPYAHRIAADADAPAFSAHAELRRWSTYVVEFFCGGSCEAALNRVKRLGFTVQHRLRSEPILVLRARGSAVARADRLRSLSEVHGVRWISAREIARPHNDVARPLIGIVPALHAAPLAVDGAGEIIAICDSGLDSGDTDQIHLDFGGRVVGIKSFPIDLGTADAANTGDDDGGADRGAGHGTHVAGSAVGSGAVAAQLSLPVPAGAAPGAKLYFQAVEQTVKFRAGSSHGAGSSLQYAGIPVRLTSLLRDAYRKGARVHSNSWGFRGTGTLDPQAFSVDQFVYEKGDLCVVIAAGNFGVDDGTGQIKETTVSSPGTAKNAITVGASQSLRPLLANSTYARLNGTIVPAPFQSPLSDTHVAGDSEKVAAFSGRGPTTDGRIKPDIVAPGTCILSTRSSKLASTEQGWARFESSEGYMFMSGTSMAAPLVAGACALVRQYLRQRGFASPSAALVKATLIAGAQRLPSVRYPGRVVDPEQGFGRLDLASILTPKAPSRAEFADELRAPETGGTVERELAVTAAGAPLRIVLAYSDPPGERLVNDLNLIVTRPDGRRYVGNQHEDVPEPKTDASNNVEAVHVAAPIAGTWRVAVVGSEVRQRPQTYALVIIGPIST